MLSTPMAASAQAIEWLEHKSVDGSNPSPDEQKMLFLLNRARTNPQAEGPFLKGLVSDATIADEYSGHGVDLDLMSSEIASLNAMAPLAYNHDLAQSQRQHNLWLIRENENRSHGAIVEDCVDPGFGTSMIGLVNQACRATDYHAGFDYNFVRYNLNAQAKSAEHYHASLTVDWGVNPFTGNISSGMQDPRGHRINRLDPNATLIGLAAEKDKDAETTKVGKLATSEIITKDRLNPGRRYLVGTVWQDLNGNGLYDKGEGIPGVRVEPENGQYFAVTGYAGGYALPMEPQPGMSFPAPNVNVDFTQGDIEVPVIHVDTVEFDGSENILLDYEVSLPSVFMTQADDPSYLWLEDGVTDQNIYTSADFVSGALTAQFENVGKDYLLKVKGFDLDPSGFSVLLNGNPIGELRDSADASYRKTKIYITREMQQPGRNDIDIVFNNDLDGVWHVTKIGVVARRVPTVDLDFGNKDRGKYGKKTGTNANQFVARYAIDMAVPTGSVQVKGLELDSTNQVQMFVNGTFYGMVIDGGNNFTGIPFNVGTPNLIEFRHLGPFRGTWGVGNVMVTN